MSSELDGRAVSALRIRPSRSVAIGIIVALLAAMLALVSSPQSASAAGNQDGVGGRGNNIVYAYLKTGESLTTIGDDARFGAIAEPDGTPHTGAGTFGPATEDGVWIVPLVTAGPNAQYDWTVEVQAADGTTIPGRTWAPSDPILQSDNGGSADLRYWVVNDTGYVYAVELNGFNGVFSVILANSVGWADDECAPTYASYEYDATGIGSNAPALPDCGEDFRIFYEEPAADLPETAPSARGEIDVLPQVLGTEALAVDDLSFTAASTGGAAGTFAYSINPRFTGGYFLQIDVDGNGSYADAVDRSVRLGADGSGSYSYEFDGLDGTGAAIEDCTAMNARIYFDKLGETHIVQSDVEARGGGISITRINGAGSPDTRIHWNDNGMPGARATTTPVLSGDGVDSSAGVHGWDFNINGWGNGRIIDDWVYLPADFGTGEISVGGRCISIEKTSDATAQTRFGDTVEYTVTATNTGDTDYTADEPAVVFDDLSGVLDDAVYQDDATASAGDAPEFIAPSHLRWSGALAAGESVEITYSVVLAAGGDGDVRNVAWAPEVPPTDVPPPTPDCDPADADGRDPVTGEPCAVEEYLPPQLTIRKAADVTDLPVDGGEVEYTVTIVNSGQGATTLDDEPVVDDLSEVLDDGALVEGSPAATVGSVVFDEDAQTLSWNGVLAAGESAVVTYRVTYDADAVGGDHELLNVVCLPTTLAQDPDDACRRVTVPGSGLDQWKSSDPASGTSVTAGDTVTYTLHFANTGETAADVDTFDDLSDVLDDADLVDGSLQAQDGLDATIDGERLVVIGSVPVGETLTVSYQVVVREYTEQDDHVLGNALDCADGDPRCETTHEIRHLNVAKSSDPAEGVDVGDVVTYTITVTADGAGDYTDAIPASITDDLSDVLDDADYNGDVAVDVSGDSTVEQPTVTGDALAWSGPLEAGEAATITYSVTITDAGDHDLVNVVCETGTDDCASTGIELPHVIFRKSSDPETGTEMLAGQVVTYTLTFINDGWAAGVVDSVDDLTRLLDDADITSAPVSSDPAVTATLLEDSIRIVGDIQPDQTITVTYQATIKPDGERGDDLLINVLVPRNPNIPPTPIVEHPIGELEDEKSVDPASGSSVQPGQEVTYTLHFRNTGKADVPVDREDDLSQVLDDAEVTSAPTASDAALTASEIVDGRFAITGSLEPGQEVAVTYTVTVKPTGERGDDRLGNYLLDPDQDPPQDCVPVQGELPDCTVNHVSDVKVVKSSDPESGSEVDPGQDITYTLTFTNVSADPRAAAEPIAYTDHMVDVLDDATLTGTPRSSDADALVAAVDGDEILITGALAPGAEATITYTVTVKAYDEQGNHRIGNVVAETDGTSICVPDSPLCTEHIVPPPSGGLPATGGEAMTGWALAGLGILATGALLAVGARRRRNG